MRQRFGRIDNVVQCESFAGSIGPWIGAAKAGDK